MESDGRYFAMHRRATTRVRFPFAGELAGMPVPAVPAGHVTVVIVRIRKEPGGRVVRIRAVSFISQETVMRQ